MKKIACATEDQVLGDHDANKEELHFMRFAFDHAADAIFWAAPDKRLIYVNDAACDHLGYTRDELLRMSVPDISVEHDAGKFAERWEVLKRTHHVRYESLHRHKSGDLIQIEISLNLMQYQDKTFSCGIVRDIRDRKRVEEALQVSEKTNRLLKDIAIAANEASGPNEALQVALERICKYKNWPVGHIYLTDPNGSPDLVSGDIWYLADAERYQTLVDITRKTKFAPGIGLPGRVYSSKLPAWIEDVSVDDNFPRFAIQSDIGIRSAFALPVLADRKVAAVLEFFAERRIPKDESLLDVVGRIGLQLGIVIERHCAQSELKQVHSQLVESARQAGQSEVATSVLHNVGNVLNSVNVSAGLIQERVRESRVSSLTKAVGIMEQHLDDLGDYVTQDERGKHLPRFLIDLSGQMVDEEQLILEEVNSLVDNIEHIKAIVATQQSYAKSVFAVVEEVSLVQLLEDAVHINSASMLRHSVEINVECDDVEPVLIDKQKLLQIMVNLISNAKYACMESGKDDHQMMVRLRREEESRVSITVQDNGMGIAVENLTSIFAHGFTTRKEGHGFGLHSAALVAKELGGSLTAHSDGPGTGATFILDLPYHTKEPSERAGVLQCTT